MLKNEFKVLLITTCLVAGCAQTPNPNFPSMDLGKAKTPPWKIPIYTYQEMELFFPTENYFALSSVYVSPDGDDQSGDGSAVHPYRTIKHAVQIHGQSGTIIRVKSGIYSEGMINLNMYASSAQPFVLYSEDGPGRAIIEGNNDTENLIVIEGQAVVIDGFEIRNCRGYGIGVFGKDDQDKGKYCVVRNNIVHHTGRDGVKSAHIEFILIEKNDISQVTNRLQYDDCIDGVAVYHSICRNNFLHDNGGGTGGYFKGGSANNIWYNNRIQNCGMWVGKETNGAGLNFGGWGQFSWRDNAWFEYPSAYEQIIFNNVFINCEMAGISIGSCQKGKIFNNSFYNCGYKSKTLIRVPEPDHVATSEISIFNNAAYNDSAHPVEKFYADNARIHKTGSLRHGYNIFFSENQDSTWNYPDNADSTEIISNPYFSNPISGDLTLLPNSPAINTGMALDEVRFDYNLNPRPAGPAYDKGAYEQ
jgi:parallel beta-helix repeat protein